MHDDGPFLVGVLDKVTTAIDMLSFGCDTVRGMATKTTVSTQEVFLRINKSTWHIRCVYQ